MQNGDFFSSFLLFFSDFHSSPHLEGWKVSCLRKEMQRSLRCNVWHHFGNLSASLWDFILMHLTLQNPLVWVSLGGREVQSKTKLLYLVPSHVSSHVCGCSLLFAELSHLPLPPWRVSRRLHLEIAGLSFPFITVAQLFKKICWSYHSLKITG